MCVTVQETDNLCVGSNMCRNSEGVFINWVLVLASLTTMFVCRGKHRLKAYFDAILDATKKAASWNINATSLRTFRKNTNSGLSVRDRNSPCASDVQLAKRVRVCNRVNSSSISKLGTNNTVSGSGTQLQECIRTRHCARLHSAGIWTEAAVACLHRPPWSLHWRPHVQENRQTWGDAVLPMHQSQEDISPHEMLVNKQLNLYKLSHS